MKALIFILALSFSAWAETTATLQVQIDALKAAQGSLLADSTATVCNDLVQADSTLAANNIKVVAHIGYGWAVSWDYPAWDFSDSTFSADKPVEKAAVKKLVQTLHNGFIVDDFVRFRKDKCESTIVTVKDIVK